MKAVNLRLYQENKPKMIRLICWRIFGRFMCVMPNACRIAMLRMFGARIGKRCLICRGARIFMPWNLQLGDYVCLGPGAEVYCKDKIVIGEQTVISQGAYLCTASHDVATYNMTLITAPIFIGRYVWVAAKAVVLPGVSVGDGVVVGCAAVVPKDVPPWKVIVGNPAKVVGERKISR